MAGFLSPQCGNCGDSDDSEKTATHNGKKRVPVSHYKLFKIILECGKVFLSSVLTCGPSSGKMEKFAALEYNLGCQLAKELHLLQHLRPWYSMSDAIQSSSKKSKAEKSNCEAFWGIVGYSIPILIRICSAIS